MTPVSEAKQGKGNNKKTKSPSADNKFSPKLLRSRARQSDVSDLLSSAKKSSGPEKAVPKKADRRKTLK
jgi:hypothetical protein